MHRLERALRISGRTLVIVGLAMVYGWVIRASFPVLPFSWPPDAFLKAGLIVATAGCFVLIGALGWPKGEKGRVIFEATLGFLSLPPVLVGILVAYGDESEFRFDWLVITALLLVGAAGLVIRAAWVKQAAERWRNTGQGV